MVWGLVRYVFHPRSLFTHLIGGGLLYGLASQGVSLRLTVAMALLEELVFYLLWLIIPNSFSTILTLFFCIHLYEKVLGPRVEVSDDAILVSDDDITQILANSGPDLSYTASEQGGRYVLATPLHYVAYTPSKWGKQERAPEVLDLDEVASVEEGCDYNIIRAIRKAGGESRQCFHLLMGAGEVTVSLLCKNNSVRDQWLDSLKQLYGKRIADLRAAWLDKLFKEADIGIQDGKITFDEAVDILNKANRKTDKPYIKEIFNTFAKISGIKTSQGETALNKDQFEKFFDMAAKRPEINTIYERMLDKTKDEKVLNPVKFQEFLDQTQKEKQGMPVVKRWIREHETILPSYNLTSVGFTNLLLDPKHCIFNREHRDVYQDMRQPLAHYYIACSHNTYLTKDQLKGKSSVDAYINAFKRGCKCVELDCWDGPNNEPIIYHGHTLTSKIKFKDVIKAIKDYAFCVSQYPVILSFENHCSVEQQQVMAKHLTTILGDMMYTKEPPETETSLPSPEKLRGSIIVKNKKLKAGGEVDEPDDEFSDDEVDEKELEELDDDDDDEDAGKNARKALKGILNQTRKLSAKMPGHSKDGAKDGDKDQEEKKDEKKDAKKEKKEKKEKEKKKEKEDKNKEDENDDDAKEGSTKDKKKKDKVPKLASELSDLVAYCQATHFKGFEYSREHAKHFEMSSFAEKKAMKFSREQCEDFIAYNKRQMSRIYPAGARIDSSNYDPTPLWNCGSQLVALNYQTGSHPMHLNQGLFTDNGGCGYVLKPEFLRSDNANFDPRGPFDDNKVTHMSIRVISGCQIYYKSESNVKSDRNLFVQVRITGVEADNQKEKTKTVKNNGFNPTWNEVLNLKVHVPELALVTFSVMEGTNTFLGQFTLPMRSMMQGYRVVPMRNKMSELHEFSSLFVNVELRQ